MRELTIIEIIEEHPLLDRSNLNKAARACKFPARKRGKLYFINVDSAEWHAWLERHKRHHLTKKEAQA
jgi:hypothetical protein